MSQKISNSNMKQQAKDGNTKEKGLIETVQTVNNTGNLGTFLTTMTLPMQAERWLIKQQRLPLV